MSIYNAEISSEKQKRVAAIADWKSFVFSVSGENSNTLDHDIGSILAERNQ